MGFGDRLREARISKGMTQEQLAREIGVAKSTLTGYEKGNREPDLFKIKRIIEALDIDAEYLFDIKFLVRLRRVRRGNCCYYVAQSFDFCWFYKAR